MKKVQGTFAKGAAGQPGHVGFRKGAPAGVGRVLAVYSGKGGVGKTFVAVGLGRALAARGLKVGLVDADIDCPNVMRMMGIEGKIVANARKKMVPLVGTASAGSLTGQGEVLKVISMAPILRGDADSLMWRGPRTSRAVEQLIHDTEWGKLDVLLVDMPPGTSDVPISVFQILGDAEVILVTTPQELAVMDARRAATMVRKLSMFGKAIAKATLPASRDGSNLPKKNIPAGLRIAGVIENMSGSVFGKGGGKTLAKDLGVPFLGQIELGLNTPSSFKKIAAVLF